MPPYSLSSWLQPYPAITAFACRQHSILSSTVIAEDCMTADALATSFMVMGLEEAEKFCKANPMIDAYFIYSGENGEFKTYYTDGMKKYIAQ